MGGKYCDFHSSRVFIVWENAFHLYRYVYCQVQLLQVAVFKDGKPLSESLDVSLELVEIECRNGTGLQTWFSKGGTAEVELGMEVLREEGLGKNTEEEYGACTGDEAKCEDRHRL